MLEDTGASPLSDVDAPGRGWLLRPSWAGGGSPGLGFSRWDFQPRPEVERWPWGAPSLLVGAARSLTNDCLREQPRIGRESAAQSPHSRGLAKKELPREWGTEPGGSELKGVSAYQFPLPGPQFSHLKNGSTTHVPGLFEQPYKIRPDMKDSGELQRTVKPSWSLL